MSEESPEKDRKTVEGEKHAKPGKALREKEHRCLFDADSTGGNGTRPRARDSGVNVAVDNVVPGAARTAHGDSTDEKEDEKRERRPALACERERPPAGQQQQPPADGAVKPREPRVRTQGRRRMGVHPVLGRGVGDAGLVFGSLFHLFLWRLSGMVWAGGKACRVPFPVGETIPGRDILHLRGRGVRPGTKRPDSARLSHERHRTVTKPALVPVRAQWRAAMRGYLRRSAPGGALPAKSGR